MPYAVTVNENTYQITVSSSGGGSGSSFTMVVGETPSGTVNGSNATFLTQFDFVPESVDVFLNGIKQKKVNDFNTSGTKTITMAESPFTGDLLLVNYQRA